MNILPYPTAQQIQTSESFWTLVYNTTPNTTVLLGPDPNRITEEEWQYQLVGYGVYVAEPGDTLWCMEIDGGAAVVWTKLTRSPFQVPGNVAVNVGPVTIASPITIGAVLANVNFPIQTNNFVAVTDVAVGDTPVKLLDLTTVTYPNDTVQSNYNNAFVAFYNTGSGPSNIVVFASESTGGSTPRYFQQTIAALPSGDIDTYVASIPIAGMDSIWAIDTGSPDGGLKADVILSQDVYPNQAMLAWNGSMLTPLLTDSSGNLLVNTGGGSGPQDVITIGSSTPATGQVSVGLTATEIVAARVNRSGCSIHNLLSNNQIVYIGFAGVTIATGYPLEAGASIDMATPVAIYGITTVSPVTVGYEDE